MEVILRDVWALLAGFAVMTALVVASRLLIARFVPRFVAPKFQDEPKYLLANLALTVVAAMAGGYVTASVATGNSLGKVLMLAIVVLAISAISILESRRRRSLGPQIAGAVLGAAGVVLGGLVRLRLLGLRW